MNNTHKRNKEIQTLSESVKKSELAKKFGLSKSRISQICSRIEKVCAVHESSYYTSCRKCSNSQHKQDKYLKDHPELRKTLRRLSGDERDAETVKMRVVVIHRLYNRKNGFSSVRIGELLNRSHATILHHLKAT